VPEPILITTNGTILAGFGRWHSAALDGRNEIDCIEYPLSVEEALPFIINHHQPRRGWNAFRRVRLALELEFYFQQRALDNMIAGGKYKGLANLPEAQRIHVRQEIARAAAVGSRSVGNVKTILQTAHPRLIDALTDGNLSINRAISWCKLPKAQQVEHFTNYFWERETEKAIRQSIGRPEKNKSNLDFCPVIDALQEQEARQPGSVLVRVGHLQSTVVLIGQDLLTGPLSQGRLKLT
jgi:hypothetical protein